jgi:hypothetical protein
VEHDNEVKRLVKEERENNFRAWGGPRAPRKLNVPEFDEDEFDEDELDEDGLDEDEFDEDELDEDEDRGELLTRGLEEVERNYPYIEILTTAEAVDEYRKGGRWEIGEPL